MSVTVKDVARVAGVSTATVSRVLNHSARVTHATRTSVDSAITLLGYRQDVHAICLSRKRRRRRVGQDRSSDKNADSIESVQSSTDENLVLHVDHLRLLVRKCEALRCQVDELSIELNSLITIAENSCS